MSLSLLEQATAALDVGRKVEGRKLLVQLVRQDQGNAVAWLLLSQVVDEPERKEYCLRRVLAIDPGNEEAKWRMAELGPQPRAATDQITASLEGWSSPAISTAPLHSAAKQVDEARALIEAGQESKGRLVLEDVVAREPLNAGAWLWLAVATTDLDKKRDCIDRALEIEPRNKLGLKLRAQLKAAAKPATLPPPGGVQTRGYEYWGPGAWIAALWPSVVNYETIISDPGANVRRACLWVAVATVAGYAVADLERMALMIVTAQLPKSPAWLTFATLCGGLVFGGLPPAIIAVLALLTAGGIVFLAGFLMRGTGTYTQVIYAIAAYLSPVIFTTYVVTAVPMAGWLLAVPVCLHGLTLSIIAAKAVHGFGWFQAILAGLAPLFLGVALVFFGVAVVAGTLGPSAAWGLQGLLRGAATPTP